LTSRVAAVGVFGWWKAEGATRTLLEHQGASCHLHTDGARIYVDVRA
jgi:hypothetical protein